jgi:DNA-binding transcriptional LysR family regulator
MRLTTIAATTADHLGHEGAQQRPAGRRHGGVRRRHVDPIPLCRRCRQLDPAVFAALGRTAGLSGGFEVTHPGIVASWCTDFAIRSLDTRDIAYRVAYSSDTSGGLKLAVVAGLAVAPISRSNIPADCRELTRADGFGEIDASRVVLHRNPRTSSEAIAGMAEAMREAFRTRTG